VTIVWTAPAVRGLREIRNYIADDKPDAASSHAARLREASETLPRQPHPGKAGRVPHTRELIVAGTPYVFIYRVASRRIEILAALHGARIR
jgi:toxin ParE1/3/4